MLLMAMEDGVMRGTVQHLIAQLVCESGCFTCISTALAGVRAACAQQDRLHIIARAVAKADTPAVVADKEFKLANKYDLKVTLCGHKGHLDC